jgi:uncharacterized membrane protein
MTIRPEVLLAILAMAAVSYACRAGGYALLRGIRTPAFVDRMLAHLPGALFAAYVAPALVAGGLAAWIGALATVLAQRAGGTMVVAVAAGIAAMWAAQAAGL